MIFPKLTIIKHVVCTLVGVIALFCQLFQRSAPVRALPRLAGKTAIVTGGAVGIGFHISKQLARLGARVIIATRSQAEGESAIAEIKLECSSADVTFLELDLASFKSVKKFVSDFLTRSWQLHILINNAGVMLVPYSLTEDGYEHHLQVNFLSHASLISLLKDKMLACAAEDGAARVVNVSSVVHHAAHFDPKFFKEKQADDWKYSPHNAYAMSKLAILLYTYALSRRWAAEKQDLIINAVHPGVVNTSLYQHVHWSIAWAINILRQLLFMTPEQAAVSVVYLAASSELKEISGFYFSNCCKTESSGTSQLPSMQEDVFNMTQDIIVKKMT